MSAFGCEDMTVTVVDSHMHRLADSIQRRERDLLWSDAATCAIADRASVIIPLLQLLQCNSTKSRQQIPCSNYSNSGCSFDVCDKPERLWFFFQRLNHTTRDQPSHLNQASRAQNNGTELTAAVSTRRQRFCASPCPFSAGHCARTSPIVKQATQSLPYTRTAVVLNANVGKDYGHGHGHRSTLAR